MWTALDQTARAGNRDKLRYPSDLTECGMGAYRAADPAGAQPERRQTARRYPRGDQSA